MPSLESVVRDARRAAEHGAREALKQLAVHHHEPWPTQSPEQRQLRNRLRAHGRQLGDDPDEKRGTQGLDRLVAECAYEHWHRLLFARFLAENRLLIEPGSGVAISLDECRELARERETDWLALASGFAVRMLPQIFRAGDPVLEIPLPPETRQKLEELLASLTSEVFTADDSLGWVYQFWQTDEKKRINESETKIGAQELAPVTQLFTEDYMVLFLLHNTLGAWWTAKRRAEGKDETLPGYEWTYLRFKDDGSPAAGAFEGWPRAAKDLKLLDPCMGSGHFLVFALAILVGFRMQEEGLTREAAVDAVLRDNLYGLELDPRCTQIAAFNLAMTAWRMTGYRPLPQLNLACSGLGINAKEEDWVRLAGADSRLRAAMGQLYGVFQRAPILGSLVDPRRVGGDLFAAEFPAVQPLLERALAAEQPDDGALELAVAARGVLAACRILTGTFSMVATNVPYLGRNDQDEHLAEYCDANHNAAKADLATAFLQRSLGLCGHGNTVALVVPQNWLFLHAYRHLRPGLLRELQWDFLLQLGEHAFASPQAAGAFVALIGLTRVPPPKQHAFVGLDATKLAGPSEKASACRDGQLLSVSQWSQLLNPDARVSLSATPAAKRLLEECRSFLGLGTGDYPRYGRYFWEFPRNAAGWTYQAGSVATTRMWGGREHVVAWDDASNRVRGMSEDERAQIHNQDQSGRQAWGKRGVAVGLMRNLKCTLYTGEKHEKALAALIPRRPELLPALWTLCSSRDFQELVRQLDQKVIVANGTLVKIPFDEARWSREAIAQYPQGLPEPHSPDPTQWLFRGHPNGAEHPLQVAVARLVGYLWPRQTGSSFHDCPALEPDGLELQADSAGIVCLPSVKGERTAADRLREVLRAAFGVEWSPAKQAELLAGAGYAGKSLEDWLCDAFFGQHCALFHQHPLVWHIWDGQRNGFAALVNYHKLAAPGGEGRRALEKLIYTYLGDWIDHQRAEQKTGVEGADARLAAAATLQSELAAILVGEPPFDIFVRWKPVHQQPTGWEPDLDDGIRLNIRPFVASRPLGARTKAASILRVTPKVNWEKDPGKESRRSQQDFPWFWGWDGKTPDFAGATGFDTRRWNDLHYTLEFKQAARARHAEAAARGRA